VFWRDSNGDVILWRVTRHGGLLDDAGRGTFATWSIAAIADFDGDGFRTSSGAMPAARGPVADDGNNTPWHPLLQRRQASSRPRTPSSPGFDSAAPCARDHCMDDHRQRGFQRRRPRDVLLPTLRAKAQSGRCRAIDPGDLVARAGRRHAVCGTDRLAHGARRPTVTKISNQVTVTWNPISGPQNYVVYASAANEPAATGVQIAAASATYPSPQRRGYADKRYFSIGASYLGVQLPPGPEAYIVELCPPHSRMGRHGDRGYQRRRLCRCAQCAWRLSRQLRSQHHQMGLTPLGANGRVSRSALCRP
jgi:hypothetical protein